MKSFLGVVIYTMLFFITLAVLSDIYYTALRKQEKVALTNIENAYIYACLGTERRVNCRKEASEYISGLIKMAGY